MTGPKATLEVVPDAPGGPAVALVCEGCRAWVADVTDLESAAVAWREHLDAIHFDEDTSASVTRLPQDDDDVDPARTLWVVPRRIPPVPDVQTPAFMASVPCAACGHRRSNHHDDLMGCHMSCPCAGYVTPAAYK